MDIQLSGQPSYTLAEVVLRRGETLVAESGAMVAMDKGIGVAPTFHGAGAGVFAGLRAFVVALIRKWLANETIFVNHFTAIADGQRVFLAPSMVGDIVSVPLAASEAITVQAGSWLGGSTSVSLSLQWGGFAALFARESPFFVRCEGPGEILVNAYGAIERVEVDGRFAVDSGHVVAWQGPLTYTIRKAGGWVSSITSGEGLVLEFSGRGTVWMQTRNTSALIGWISPLLPG